MTVQNEFVEYLIDLLVPLGQVQAKVMFGGFGIYLNDLMFGIVSHDTLYLKTDDRTLPDFESRELPPFSYQKQGKDLSLSYYQAPQEAMEDPEEICKWAQDAYEAALRAAKNKRKKK